MPIATPCKPGLSYPEAYSLRLGAPVESWIVSVVSPAILVSCRQATSIPRVFMSSANRCFASGLSSVRMFQVAIRRVSLAGLRGFLGGLKGCLADFVWSPGAALPGVPVPAGHVALE